MSNLTYSANDPTIPNEEDISKLLQYYIQYQAIREQTLFHYLEKTSSSVLLRGFELYMDHSQAISYRALAIIERVISILEEDLKAPGRTIDERTATRQAIVALALEARKEAQEARAHAEKGLSILNASVVFLAGIGAKVLLGSGRG